MNHLNSVLLSGVLKEKPTLRGGITSFCLLSTRESQISSIQVKVTGRLGELYSNRLNAGSKVRIVGYLESKTSDVPELWDIPNIWIVAEHVEMPLT